MKKILFLGRHGCTYSDALERHLRQFGHLSVVLSSKRGDPLPAEALRWRGEFIFSFRNFFIVPKSLLDESVVAVNFHPAPPEYPGSGGANWALYEGASSFGVTAHFMDARVDSGAILGVRRFPIKDSDSLRVVLERSYSELLLLAVQLSTELLQAESPTDSTDLLAKSDEIWSTQPHKAAELDSMSQLDSSMTMGEVERRVRAFHTDSFPCTLTLGGVGYRLATLGSQAPTASGNQHLGNAEEGLLK